MLVVGVKRARSWSRIFERVRSRSRIFERVRSRNRIFFVRLRLLKPNYFF